MPATLAFDVYGTLIDTSGILTAIREMTSDKAEALNALWRRKQLEYSFRYGLMEQYVDFSVVTRNALDYSCQALGVDLGEGKRNSLMEQYRVLPAFPDAAEALPRLKADGHRIFAFSNGSEKAVRQLLEQAGLSHYFEAAVSVEGVQTFKPSPRVYAYFNAATQTEKEQTWLISGNPFDLIGARYYGMQAAWVRRSKAVVFDPLGVAPSATVGKLMELPALFRG